MKPAVLITGGSSGVGFALSKLFAEQDAHLLWVAKTEDEISAAQRLFREQFPHVKLDTLALDLSRLDAAQKVFEWTEQLQTEVDILVNNAGYGTWGFQDTISEARDIAMFQLNMMTPYLLMRRFLPQMRARDGGHIVNVASSAGIINSAGFSAYGATKAFLRFYSISMNIELQLEGSNVKITAACPSAIKDTPFRDIAGMGDSLVFETPLSTTQEEVASDIFRAIQRGQEEIVSGRWLRLALPMLRRLPRWLVLRMTRMDLSREPEVLVQSDVAPIATLESSIGP